MNLSPHFLAFAALATIAAPAISAPVAQPTAWLIDKGASQLGFTASMNGQAIIGHFGRWEARIRFDPKALATSQVAVIIDTASAHTGDATRDEALPTADWFSAKAFPTARFVAARFENVGGDHYRAIGTLTIRGIAKPAVLPFQLAIKGDVATMRGSLVIDRLGYGVGQGQFATADAVAAEVKVDVTVRATAAR